MAGIDVTVDGSKIGATIEACDEAIRKALTECGLIAEATAKKLLTEQKAVDTGNLRNSVTFELEADGNTATMSVGTAVHYAQYVEFGTGEANVPGGSPKPSWVYKGEDGEFHRGFPQKPRPFIKPAIADNKDKFRQIIEKELKTSVDFD